MGWQWIGFRLLSGWPRNHDDQWELVASSSRLATTTRFRMWILSDLSRVVRNSERITRGKIGLFSVRNVPNHQGSRTSEFRITEGFLCCLNEICIEVPWDEHLSESCPTQNTYCETGICFIATGFSTLLKNRTTKWKKTSGNNWCKILDLSNYIAKRLATFERKVLRRMSGGSKVHENWRKR